MSTGSEEILAKILAFFDEIGIEAELVPQLAQSFLPGIDICKGKLLIDKAQLAYPGDLLHEAGHLAILPVERRRRINHDAGGDPGDEMTAIAWSYAAAIHLHIDLQVVFHEEGYRGGSQAIIDNFARGRYIGVPVLQWLGLTADKKNAALQGIAPYPHMIRWTVD